MLISNILKTIKNRFLRIPKGRHIVLYSLLGLGLFMIGLGLFVWLRPAHDRDYDLTIASGSPAETRNAILRYFKRKAPTTGMTLTETPCEGSTQALEMINSGKLDLALIQGLVRIPHDSNVRHVTTFYSEPVHLLVKQELEKEVRENLKHLAGRRININAHRTATSVFAPEMLEFVGLKANDSGPHGYTPTHMSNVETQHAANQIRLAEPSKKKALRAKLPDAFIVINTLPSQTADALVNDAGYRLVPLKFGKAMAMLTVDEEEHDADYVDQLHLEINHIPAFTYSVSPPVPAEPLETLGVPMVLVANKDVPNKAVIRLLSLIYRGPVHNIYHPPPLSQVEPEYPFHPGAIQFRDRDKPLLRADVVDGIGRILRIGGLFVAGLIALYGYYRWYRLMQFRAYFRRLLELRNILRGLVVGINIPQDDAGRRRYVSEQLTELQRRALMEFCNNYFFGEGVLQILQGYIVDTRNQIATAEAAAEQEAEPAKIIEQAQ